MKPKIFFEENINNLDTPWATAPLTALPGEVIVVAVVNLVAILPDTDIECLVVVSPGSVVDPGLQKRGA